MRKRPGRKESLLFQGLTRQEQLGAFFHGLPPRLQEVSGIDWTVLPAKVMAGLLSLHESPYATSLAIGAVAAAGKISNYSLNTQLGHLKRLLASLWKRGDIEHIWALNDEHIWGTYASETEQTPSRAQQLNAYSSWFGKHVPALLHRLSQEERSKLQDDVLPPLPPQVQRKYGGRDLITKNNLSLRQAQYDTLGPHYPSVRQVVMQRYQAASRLFAAIGEAHAQAFSEETAYPLQLMYSDTLPVLSWGNVSEASIHQRQVKMEFLLWNKRSWVREHPERYSVSTWRKATSRTGAYRRECELFFVQYLGPSENFLWLGDLVSDRLLHCFHKENRSDPDYMFRRRLARERGFPLGCRCGRPGLLNAPAWLAGTEEPGDCLFDPEALRLALLFGTALAVLFLTHGMAVNTLLQLSRDRWVETPSGRQQWLLPGTGKSDADRCLFPVEEGAFFLEEITRELEAVHHGIPVVAPSRKMSISEYLHEERYLFQWGASEDGRYGLLTPEDVQVLVRLLLYGLDLRTKDGTSIPLVSRLLQDGGETSLEQRSRLLLQTFGFNEDILSSYSATSRQIAVRAFYEYFKFAGSKEQALDPATFCLWKDYLSFRYENSTSSSMIRSVKRMIESASIETHF